jgi:hypothetical protein
VGVWDIVPLPAFKPEAQNFQYVNFSNFYPNIMQPLMKNCHLKRVIYEWIEKIILPRIGCLKGMWIPKLHIHMEDIHNFYAVSKIIVCFFFYSFNWLCWDPEVICVETTSISYLHNTSISYLQSNSISYLHTTAISYLQTTSISYLQTTSISYLQTTTISYLQTTSISYLQSHS